MVAGSHGRTTMTLRSLVKRMVVHSPLRYSERAEALLRLTKLGPWIRRHQPHPYFPTREQLHAHVANTVVGQQAITYLEFGVYQGASLNGWMRLNSAAESEFIGFSVNCTHLGCPVRWLSDAGLFMCPCHGGVYYSDGTVAAGPPPKPLIRYDVRTANGQVQIKTMAIPITTTTRL